MADAVRRAGRHEADVRLVAVTKYARLDWIRELLHCGCRVLGESRPQQFVQRVADVESPVEWHFIGHLQRNKARLVVPHAGVIHSVDSLRLLERINQIAVETRVTPQVLLEVNVSGESTKQGFVPETLEREWSQLVELSPVPLAGLMTMAPAYDDPEQARPVFRALRQLRDHLVTRSPVEVSLGELSMGMSGDFEVAIEEGATLVRVGSALFEGLSAE
ncbi:MAG: YggS family pyridoxal phosphate-dependent enzyme [Planctomycetaceae bacterium]|nr:YggS family pyridoxal phosphate-dependent enzyme [Planctomycetaceae bacterium]